MIYKQLWILALYFFSVAYSTIVILKQGELFPFTKVRSLQETKPRLVLDKIQVKVKNGETTISVGMKEYNDMYQVRDYSWYMDDLPIGPGLDYYDFMEPDEIKLADPDFKVDKQHILSRKRLSKKVFYDNVQFTMHTMEPIENIVNKTFKLYVRFRNAEIALLPSIYFFRMDTRYLITIKGRDLIYPDEGSSKCHFDELHYNLERERKLNYRAMFRFNTSATSKINKAYASFEGFDMSKNPPAHVQLYDRSNNEKQGSPMLNMINKLSTPKKSIVGITLSEKVADDHLGMFMIGADTTSNCYDINVQLSFDFTNYVFREGKSWFPPSALKITHFEQISDGHKRALVCRVLGRTGTDVSLYRKSHGSQTRVKVKNNIHISYHRMITIRTLVFNSEEDRQSGTYYCVANFNGAPGDHNTVEKNLDITL